MAISDATVLLAFCLIDRVDVLVKLTGKLTVPFAVKGDVTDALRVLAPGKTFPSEDLVDAVIIDVPASLLRQSETEALALAERRGAKTLLSDDACVREVALEHGIKPLGTAGLLYAAQRKGLLKDVPALLDTLQSSGYTFATRFREEILRRTGPA